MEGYLKMEFGISGSLGLAGESAMFDWLKSKSRRETGRLNALLAEVFAQLGEERLRQAVADGAVSTRFG